MKSWTMTVLQYDTVLHYDMTLLQYTDFKLIITFSSKFKFENSKPFVQLLDDSGLHWIAFFYLWILEELRLLYGQFS